MNYRIIRCYLYNYSNTYLFYNSLPKLPHSPETTKYCSLVGFLVGSTVFSRIPVATYRSLAGGTTPGPSAEGAIESHNSPLVSVL